MRYRTGVFRDKTMIMGGVFSALLLFSTGCASPSRPILADLPPNAIIDLTHSFGSDTIYWPTEEGFVLEKGPAGKTAKGYYYSANRMRLAEHGGTHLDAPIHFYADRNTVDQIPVEQLIGEGVVLNISWKCRVNRDYQVRVDDILEWEDQNGPLPPDVILLIRTDYGKEWPDRLKYLGTDLRGAEAVAALHFPGLDPDAALWLTTQRKVKAIGIDTPSIDYGQSTQFQSHVRLFEKNIPALENVANLHLLPSKGFSVLALPMKIKDGSGAPLRIVAILR